MAAEAKKGGSRAEKMYGKGVLAEQSYRDIRDRIRAQDAKFALGTAAHAVVLENKNVADIFAFLNAWFTGCP